MFKITTYRNGRKRVARFPTLEAAKQCAQRLFEQTGVIVGIERA
jgi:hypothetical protein